MAMNPDEMTAEEKSISQEAYDLIIGAMPVFKERSEHFTETDKKLILLALAIRFHFCGDARALQMGARQWELEYGKLPDNFFSTTQFFYDWDEDHIETVQKRMDQEYKDRQDMLLDSFLKKLMDSKIDRGDN